MLRRIPNLLIGLAFLCASCSGSEQRATDLGGKAQALADAGDLVSARRTIAEAIAERDDIAALYLLQGQLALRANAPTEAYNAFSNALTLDASNPVALQSVAQLALGFGRYEVAEETADRILALQPEQPDAMFVKGLAQLERHRPEVADKLAESILQRAPRDERGLALKARVLFFQGRPDEAIERIERNSDVGTRTVLLSGRCSNSIVRTGADRKRRPSLRIFSRHIPTISMRVWTRPMSFIASATYLLPGRSCARFSQNRQFPRGSPTRSLGSGDSSMPIRMPEFAHLSYSTQTRAMPLPGSTSRRTTTVAP